MLQENPYNAKYGLPVTVRGTMPGVFLALTAPIDEVNQGIQRFQWRKLTGRTEPSMSWIEDRAPLDNMVTGPDLSKIGLRLLSDTDALESTYRALGINPKSITQVQGTVVTAGDMGIILLIGVSLPDRTEHFVVNMARCPKESENANYVEQEYHDLTELFDRMTGVDSQYHQRFGILRPFAQGITPEVNGRQYPFYTAPYIYGNIIHIEPVPLLIPPCDPHLFAFMFREHAFPVEDTKTEYQTQKRAKAALRVARGIIRDPLIHDSLQAFDRYCVSNVGQEYMSHIKDLIRMQALLYLLSDGRDLPRATIASSDHMGNVIRNHLTVIVTSLRGGFGDRISPEDWIDSSVLIAEGLTGEAREMTGIDFFTPLAYIDKQVYREILDEVRSAIK